MATLLKSGPGQVLRQIRYIIYEELISFEVTHLTLHPGGLFQRPRLVDFGTIGLAKTQVYRARRANVSAPNWPDNDLAVSVYIVAITRPI
jgi:hypothetical protein